MRSCVRALCVAATPPVALTPMERADREDAIAAWLEGHAADAAAAASLAETGVTIAALDALAAVVAGGALDAALRWIAAGSLLRSLASDIDTATSAISKLVAAVKGFTYMDRAASSEPVDIRRGIRDTLTMLGAKSRAKSVAVTVDLAPDLPGVSAFGAELNQVWVNLIDNALDAVAASGQVTVTARRELGRVVVRVIDDGPGIPADIQRQIYDPFFTTKPVGQGTGLGLDIARRLVRRHGGEIDLDSRPGHTEFIVSLPAEGAARPTPA